MVRSGLVAVFAIAVLTACGSAGADGPDPDTPDSVGMCAPDTPDCDDVAVGDGDGGDFDSAAALAEARALLGTAEDDLPAEVRVGRRGEEQFMLTEDYVLGRHTVELDADAAGTYRVTAVTTELPDGPETTR